MKKICQILFAIGFFSNSYAQSTVQNCMGAIPICQNTYNQTTSYTGFGTQSELNGSNQGCLTTGELNSVWYILNTSSTGSLVFTISPAIATDYDFAVWDITDKSCAAIGAGLQPIRCNYASLPNSSPGGLTGLSTAATNPSVGAGGGSFSSAINASAGQTFVILINNSSGSSSGYLLDFTGSSSQIVDNIAPTIKADTLPAGCGGPSSIKILLSENVICSSFATNGSDFSLTPASSTITGASSASCSTGGSYTNLFNLNFSAPLTPGTYNLSIANGTDGNTLLDNCGNAMSVGSSISFTVLPAIQIGAATQAGCAGLPTGVITASSSGGTLPYLYKLNSGGYTSNNVFSGLLAGTYTITVKDVNGCTSSTVAHLISGPPININSLSISNLTCYGINTGSITVNATGGTPPLTYAINAGSYSSSNLITNLGPGSYIVHVKDANGCIVDQVAFISSPGQIIINSYTSTNATCGSNNGSIQLAAFGGLPPLTYSLNSNPFQPTGNFNALAAGTYTLHIKDANNCLKDTVVNITQVGNVSVTSLTAVQPNCVGNSGSITVNANGGVLPYAYSINGGPISSLNIFSGLASGNYTILVSDANNCTASSNITLISPNNLFFGNVSFVSPTCLTLGNIVASGVGGNPPYQFALNSGAYSNLNSFNGLVAGIYILHIKDNSGCIHDTTLTLSPILVPSITALSITQPSCSFPNAGSIQVIASGGTLPYTYSLNGAGFVTSSNFNSLSGGTYTVIVKDATGCTSSSVANLTTINALSFSAISSTNVGCGGSPLGSIHTILSNGNPAYQYSLNGGPFQTSGQFNGLSGGSYTVVGKDASGCTVSVIININSSSILTINTVSFTNSPCLNPPTGSIQINGAASALPLTYQLNFSTSNTTGIFNSLTAGVYTVSIFDANGCHKDSTVVISAPPSMFFSSDSVSIVPCSGGTGHIIMQGAGGTPPYTYSLDTSPYSPVSSWLGITAGTYTIHLQDANGCIYDTIVSMIEPYELHFNPLILSNASCNGLNNGSITINATGGTGTILYAINAGAYSTINTFTNLGPGTYVLHLKDANGCTQDTLVQITNNGNFLINSISMIQPDCHGGSNGSIQLTVIGGLSPYQYAINSSAFSSSNSFTNLTSASYTIHAIDNSGCTSDSVVQLNQPSQLTFVSMQVTAVTCFGGSNGSILMNAMGGVPSYQFKIDAGTYTNATSFTGLTSGLHTLSVKDSKNCSKDSIIFIPQPNPITFNNVSIIAPGCLGTIGVIQVGANGGIAPYTFAIGAGPYSSNGTFNNLPSGTYTIHVKDNNNCIHDTIISIISTQLIQLTSFFNSSVLCPNSNLGYINATATSLNPPISYSSNGGAPQASGNFFGLTSGSYTIHIEDQLGCYIDSVVNIQSAPPIQISNIQIITPLCHNSADGSILISAFGGLGSLQYAYNTGSYSSNNLFSNLMTGIYTLHIKDSLFCSKDSIINLPAPPPLTFSSIALVNPYCSNAVDGKITIVASGGQAPYVYAINSSLFTTNNQFQNLFQGVYTVFVKDYNGCIYDTVIMLNAANYMDFTNVNLQHVSCKNGNNGSISLNVSGGYSPYQFTINLVSTGTVSTFGNLAVGSYTIVVTDLIGCQADTVISILEPALPVTALILNTKDNLCRGDSTGTITAGGSGGTLPYTYSKNATLFQSSPFFGGLHAGAYLITIQDANGCLDDTLAYILEPDTSVQLVLLGIKDQSCIHVNDGSIDVSSKYGKPPLNYYFNAAWVGLDTSYDLLAPGNYIVEVKDSLGCKSTGKFVVDSSDRRPYIILDSLHGIVCAGDKDGAMDWHTINTFPPYYYTFDGMNLDTTSFINGITNGSYIIHVVDSIGCYADTTITLEEGDKLDLKVETIPALCQGIGDDGKAIAIPIGGIAPFSYTWSGQFGNKSDHAILWYGNQMAYVKDSLGCVDSTEFEIAYDPCCVVNLPNAFSPNGDGTNDIFRIIRYGQINLISLEVYNRWGNCVFKTVELTDGWDGKYGGVDCELGTYFYILRYRCHLKNENIMDTGDVTLIR